jgi:solute:Na+ symporter, SSS family
MGIEWLDVGTFVLSLLVTFVFGIYMSGREDTASDFFLAGWRIPWYAIGLSLFATNISSGSLIALAGDAYRYGIAVSTLEWGAVLGLIILAFVFLPYYRQTRVFTTPEFLEARYGPVARMLFAVTATTVELLIYMPYMFYAGGLFFGVMFDFPYAWSVISIALFVGAYTTFGGLAAVVWTDSLQAVLMLIGGVIVTVFGLIKIGGMSAFLARVPDDRMHVCLPLDHPAYPFPATMIGGYFLVTVYYWCQNQTIVQRAFAGRSEWDSRMGAISACYIKLILPLLLVLPGILAVVLFPELGLGKEADQALPLLIKSVVPTGLMGLVMASIMAALMSSASSGFNSLATIFTNDFYRRWLNPRASESNLVLVGRLASVGILVVTIARALTMRETPSLMQFLQVGLVYLATPVIVVFTAGIFWRGATSAAAVTVLLAAPFVCLACQFAHLWKPGWPEHMVYWMPIAVAFLTILLVAVSLVTTRKTDAELDRLVWSRKKALAYSVALLVRTDTPNDVMFAGKAALWRDHRLWAAGAILLMILEIWWLR